MVASSLPALPHGLFAGLRAIGRFLRFQAEDKAYAQGFCRQLCVLQRPVSAGSSVCTRAGTVSDTTPKGRGGGSSFACVQTYHKLQHMYYPDGGLLVEASPVQETKDRSATTCNSTPARSVHRTPAGSSLRRVTHRRNLKTISEGHSDCSKPLRHFGFLSTPWCPNTPEDARHHSSFLEGQQPGPGSPAKVQTARRISASNC